MSRAKGHGHRPPRAAARKEPHHLIIARGERIRSYTIRPKLILTLCALGLVLAVGSVGAAGYYYLQGQSDTALAHQGEIRATYEAEIAELHRQLDSVVSRSLVEQHSVDQQISELVARQNVLNERQQLLTGVATDAIRVGIEVLPALVPAPTANPLRLDGEGRVLDPLITGAIDIAPGSIDVDATIASIEAAMTALEADQEAAVATLAEAVTEHNGRVANALESIGYDPDVASNVGGPFVPLDPAEAFHDNLAYVAGELETFASLQAYARDLPLAQPLANLQITSNFGRRRDPFLGQVATHTGVDFGAVTGTIIRATAPGRVVSAGTNGGYGRMVEIDHGNGLTTRYAHMSSIAVRVGDVIETGTMVGRAGSTGRSTGPHLHYEIRRNGQAIDPLPFVRAGQQISSILR
ncbi:MAG: peptidoglycan DD-metalloendopeptidase family protein [Bauldia sp.]|nr:peptidoglycan DD-metalloendopeptidase family protein [Bauldia sp.]